MAVQEKKPAGAIRRLGYLLIGAAVTFSACTGTYGDRSRPEPGSEAGAFCRVDSDCGSGFCDQNACADPSGVYGRPCQPAPVTNEGIRDGKLNICGAYVCLDQRCRSCTSDTQCQSEYGAPYCRDHETRPGKRCGS